MGGSPTGVLMVVDYLGCGDVEGKADTSSKSKLLTSCIYTSIHCRIEYRRYSYRTYGRLYRSIFGCCSGFRRISGLSACQGKAYDDDVCSDILL